MKEDCERPLSALNVDAIKVGDRLVSYPLLHSTQDRRTIELEVEEIKETTEWGEYITIIKYVDFSDGRSHEQDAMSLGLTPDANGIWSRCAIPLDD
jgi:hypothetical protein